MSLTTALIHAEIIH